MTGNDILILSFIFLVILSISGYFLIDRKIHDIEQSISSLSVFLYTIFSTFFMDTLPIMNNVEGDKGEPEDVK